MVATHVSTVLSRDQIILTKMAKFFALALGTSAAMGSVGNVAAFGVRPRCVHAPDEESVSIISLSLRSK